MNKKNRLCFIAITALAVTSLFMLSAGCTPKIEENATDGTDNEGEELVFQSKRGYISATGCPTIVGEVKNAGDFSFNNILITASFYCSKDKEVGAGEDMAAISSYTEIEILAPGEMSPFKAGLSTEELARLPNFDVDKIGKYKVEVSSYDTTEEHLYKSFEITQSSGELSESTGLYKVTGRVKNTGTEPAEQIKVIATFYEKQTNIVEVINTYLQAPLLPGDEAQFELTVADETISQRIETYSTQAVVYEEG